MTESQAADQWQNRTTFQRVYDVVVGSHDRMSAQDVAERAGCSEAGARNALEQLAEMGIAERRDGRPTQYRRNDSYLRWKRIESLVGEYSPAELRERVDELISEDRAFQAKFGVPEPDAVGSDEVAVDDHDALHEHWENLSEWRTVRRDIRLLRRAIDRAAARTDDGVRA